MAEGRVDKRDDSKPPVIFLSVLRGPLGEVARVLAFGNKKYQTIRNFMTIEDGANRMASAAIRHLQAWGDNEPNDPESGISHLAHAACDALMALWFVMSEPHATVGPLFPPRKTGEPDPDAHGMCCMCGFTQGGRGIVATYGGCANGKDHHWPLHRDDRVL
jgi:hypothetical protein